MSILDLPCVVEANKTIDYNEFLNFATNKDKILQQQNLLLAFNAFDTDGSGTLSFVEIEQIFKKGNKNWGNAEKEQLQKLLKQANKAGTGEISFKEFEALMRKFFI